MVGKVFLVGTGSGDPDLIIVKVQRLIRAASVILQDRLIVLDLWHEASSYREVVTLREKGIPGYEPAIYAAC